MLTMQQAVCLSLVTYVIFLVLAIIALWILIVPSKITLGWGVSGAVIFIVVLSQTLSVYPGIRNFMVNTFVDGSVTDE